MLARAAARSWILALALASCDGAVPPPDAQRADSGEDGGGDGGAPVDRLAPTLVDATPDDGTDGVARDVVFEARFSEPMRTPLGTVRVRVEGEEVVVTPALVEEHRLRIEPPGGAWPAASEIEVRIGADFADRAGNALDRAYALRFTTVDDVAPVVVSASPDEAATDVSVRAGAVRVRFSKPMDQAAGAVRLEGGPGTIDADAPAWSPFEVSYAVHGLAHDTAYRVILTGFRDRAGNALDGAPVLGDGALDFRTRTDDESPRVARSAPVEGQVDVLVERLEGTIEVELDEAMDTSVTTAPLTVGGTTTVVPITWVDARTARFAAGAALRTEAAHSLDLRGLRDLAGNAIDPAPYLGDGRLDFVTGVDAFVPFVAASSPAEGETLVPLPMADVVLAFSEAMDESLDEVTLSDDLGRTSAVRGTWQAGATLLVLPGSAFTGGRAISVDVRELRDLSGTPVSAVHPYLGDGRLDFTVARPTGSSCDEPLLIEHADAVVGDRYELTITRAQRTRNNGSASCDPDGPAETDAVILYRKTTPALGDPSGAGRALRISTLSVTNRANIEVFSGVCEPTAPAAAAARQLCVTGHASWDQLLDLPAGDHYLWFSTADGSPFDIRLALTEVDAIPEGERCEAPYGTSSAGYSAPSAPGQPHVWDLPAGPHNSVDIAAGNGAFQAISCREEPFGDVVIAFPKTTDDTVLDVRVGGASVTAEVVTGACRGDDPAATRAACVTFASASAPRRMTAAGPAGDTFVWVAGTSSSAAFPGGRVEIRELPAPTAPGSSCETAIAITAAASVSVTPDHAERYYGPSCVPVDSNVTWYAFETTEALTRIRTDGVGALGVVHPGTRREVGCRTNAMSDPVTVFAPPGTRVCVAVESASAVSQLAIESIPYDGLGTVAPTRLNITPPSLALTPYSSILGDTWLALTPTLLWQNIGTAGLVVAPRGGGVQASARFDVDGAILGDETIAVGHELYSMDLNNSGSRLFRLTDATGAWAPTLWDPGASYARNTRCLTFDGAALFTVDHLTSATVTPRLSAIYRMSYGAPATPTTVGSVSTIYNIDAIAADATWFYLSGQESTSVRGLYRVLRSEVEAGVGVPERIAAVPALAAVRIDDLASPRYMYLRDTTGDIHVLESPGGASPRYLGVIFDGLSGDRAMDLDRASGTLVFFSTHEVPEGEWYRYGP